MRRLITAAMIGTSLAAGTALVACGSPDDDTVEVAEYEDCDAEDKAKREDDCGYWQKGTQYFVGAQPDSTWIFIYYSWVLQGLTRPPAGWVPPRGVTPRTRVVTRPKSKVCSMSLVTDVLVAPAPPRPPAPAPARPAPARPPANNPPKVNNPPKQPAKQYTPPKPGVRPAGC